jgi:hypothetical protein
MGMDVSGIDPDSKAGEYFRANCWSWRPIHALVDIANQLSGGALVDEETMRLMGYNDGAGLKTKEACNLLADAVEGLLEEPEKLRMADLVVSNDGEETIIGFKLDPACAVRSDGRFVRPGENVPLDDLHSPYSVGMSHAKEFVEFLRHCGGFEVC